MLISIVCQPKGGAMAIEEITEAAETPPFPPSRRRGRIGGLAGFVALVLASWVLVAMHPAVAQGSFSSNGSMRVANDGVSDTRLVVVAQPGARATFLISVRNAGRVPFTVLEPEAGSFWSRVVRVGFQPVLNGGRTIPGVESPTVPELTLEPGAEAGVQVRVEIPPCFSLAPGARSETTEVAIQVRQLGIVTARSIPLELPLTLVGPREVAAPAPDCETGG